MTAATTQRRPHHEVHEVFHRRWSPRAFTDEEIPETALLRLFEAARWAPSAMNAQPWRFVWARRGTPAFDRFLGALAPANRAWAARAAVLVAVISRTHADGPQGPGTVPLPSHSFDAGAAWAHLALQAEMDGWSTHAMGGFDRGAAHDALLVPDGHQVEVLVAVGRRGDPGSLPEPLRAREHPSDRRPVGEIAREGVFDF